MPHLRRPFSALLLCAAACVTQRTPTDIEREYAKTLKPAQIEAAVPEAQAGTVAKAATLRRFRVRVLADAEYRSQVLRWEQAIRRLFDDASAITEAQFGVRLEVVEVVPWARTGNARELPAVLAELTKDEPGRKFDWIVGFVGSLDVFSAAQHQLGLAEVFGNYGVLRGMENLAEASAVTEAFRHLPLAEREQVLQERLEHKRIAVLLHEWAHVLGGLHERSDETLLSPVYDPRQARFAPESRELIRIGLAHHAGAPNDAEERVAWAREVRAFLSSSDASAWDAGERTDFLTRVAALSEAPARREPPPWPEEERLRFNRAVELARTERIAEASAELAPLLTPTTTRAPVLDLGCELALRRRGLGAHDLETCVRAAKVPDAMPFAALRVAHLKVMGGDVPGAVAQLKDVHAQPPVGEARSPEWDDYFASLLQQSWCITWAEELVDRLPSARQDAVRTWAATNRRAFGLTRAADPAVAAEAESAYILRFRAVRKESEAGHVPVALTGAEELAKAYPGSAGALALVCEMNLRAGRTDKGRTACEQAVKADDGLPNVHGWLAMLVKSPTESAQHLRKLIALDPSQEAAARESYRQRFHRDLPAAGK